MPTRRRVGLGGGGWKNEFAPGLGIEVAPNRIDNTTRAFFGGP